MTLGFYADREMVIDAGERCRLSPTRSALLKSWFISGFLLPLWLWRSRFLQMIRDCAFSYTTYLYTKRTALRSYKWRRHLSPIPWPV